MYFLFPLKKHQSKEGEVSAWTQQVPSWFLLVSHHRPTQRDNLKPAAAQSRRSAIYPADEESTRRGNTAMEGCEESARQVETFVGRHVTRVSPGPSPPARTFRSVYVCAIGGSLDAVDGRRLPGLLQTSVTIRHVQLQRRRRRPFIH